MVATEMMQRYKKLQFERGESAQEQGSLPSSPELAGSVRLRLRW